MHRPCSRAMAAEPTTHQGSKDRCFLSGEPVMEARNDGDRHRRRVGRGYHPVRTTTLVPANMNEPAGGTPRGARRGDGLAVTATRPSPSTRHSTFLGEARLAAFVRFARDAIYSRDADGIITTWNPAAEELYGYAAHEIVGQPLSVLVPEEQAAAEGEVQRRTFAG